VQKPSGEIRRGLSSFPRTRLDEKPAPKRVSKGDGGEIKGDIARGAARRGDDIQDVNCRHKPL